MNTAQLHWLENTMLFLTRQFQQFPSNQTHAMKTLRLSKVGANLTRDAVHGMVTRCH